MNINRLASFGILVSLTLFLLNSCSGSRGATERENGRSAEEYEDKPDGTNTSGMIAKGVLEEYGNPGDGIIMPDAVDVSDYIPPWLREEREAEAMATASARRLRRKVVEFGKEQLGSPYKYGGADPKTGFDCSGLTTHVYKKFNINLGRSSRSQALDGKEVSIKRVLPGDLVIFAINGRINHVAMVMERKGRDIYVIHSTSRGVVIDNISKSTYWKSKILQARRVI